MSNASDKALILITDDTPETLQGMARVLQDAGFRVIKAATGAECITMTQQHRPDLILLDVVLPDMAGPDVARHIKASPDYARSYIILVSGLRTSPDEKVSGLDAGADGYITRPITNRELLAQVRAILRLRDAEITVEQQEAESSARQEREMLSLDSFHGEERTRLTAHMLGIERLSIASPEIFNTLVQQYSTTLDLALEQRMFRVDQSTSDLLLALGETLGRLNAGPRDVVEIHKQALKDRVPDQPPEKIQAYLEEGRIMVLELMGYLAAYYRAYSTFAARRFSPPGADLSRKGNQGGP